MQDTRVRRSLLRSLAGAAFLAFLAVSLSAGTVLAQGNSNNSRNNILFTQQDSVQKFDINFGTGAGSGYQVGTTVGKISGTSSVLFQVQLEPSATGIFPLTFTNSVTITDIDGDQIYFLNAGTGKFHLGDTTFVGSGGPLTGTYEVTGGTGKYASWKVGARYPYRAIATNPPLNGFGTVYVEVYSNPLKKTD
jgi:hypothetical protein